MLTRFIREKAKDYQIDEMSIVFGILAVGSFFPVLMLGAILNYALGLAGSIAVPLCLVLWVGFVIWLWVAFVLVGRESARGRISTSKLTAMQMICFVVIGGHVLFARPEERQTWESIAGIFAWVIVAFHVIYFTLAWAMRAPVPLRTYLTAALVITFVWWRF